MRSFKSLWTLAALLWCFTGLAWANPRVAIVTPISGNAWLGEAPLTSPKMAEEGQKLVVAEGAKVRLQLLGSSKEKVVTGVAAFAISKAGLEKDGKVLSRGSIAVADEIGNIQKAAAAAGRDTRVGNISRRDEPQSEANANYRPVGFALVLPPAPGGPGWEARVATPLDQIKIPIDSGFEVTVIDLTDLSKDPMVLTVDRPVDSLGFENESLNVGHRYRVFVTGPKSGYSQFFQILTPEERSDLTKTAHAMRVDALKNDEVAVLLRLANFYSSFDETEKVADVLTEVVNKPSYKQLDELAQKNILDALNQTLNSLDRKSYNIP